MALFFYQYCRVATALRLCSESHPRPRHRSRIVLFFSGTYACFPDTFLGTKLLSKEDCIAFYTRKPHLHPAKKNLQAYFEMYRVNRARYRCKEPGEKHWFCELAYDAVEVANGLRRMQGKVLSSCGMDTPTYKKINLGVDNKSESRENDAGLYEQLVDRQPAKSVTIIRRRYDRQLLNTQEILTMCQSLNLVCRIFDSGSIFNTEKARDVCFILKHFKDAVTIGVQGAEIVYPHYTHGRLILVVPDRLDQHSTTIHAARFGTYVMTYVPFIFLFIFLIFIWD